MKHLLLVLLPMLLLTTCDKEVDNLSVDSLTADWQLQEFSITRASSGQEIFKRGDKYTWLLLDADGTYARNFVTGSWSLDGNTIKVQPLPNTGARALDYEVLSVSDEQLTVRYLTTAQECNCGLESVIPGSEQAFRTDRFLKR
ncbi:hypothetical protein [Neolewinella maritima]|nr:hypothetical protein [Neolewinella maritima]